MAEAPPILGRPPPPTMKLILALVDFSDLTSDVVTLAASFARAFASRLILLHVAMPDSDFVDGKQRKDTSRQGVATELHRRHRELKILQTELTKLRIQADTRMVRGGSVRGNPVPKMVQEIDRLAPDLIIMGSRGRGRLYESVIGSVTDAVVRKVRCPVLLVPGHGAASVAVPVPPLAASVPPPPAAPQSSGSGPASSSSSAS